MTPVSSQSPKRPNSTIPNQNPQKLKLSISPHSNPKNLNRNFSRLSNKAVLIKKP
jgi:hypothetical protein